MTFEYALAQLRHLYAQMVNGQVKHTKEAAEGLLGPSIEVFEQLLTRAASMGKGEFTNEEVMQLCMMLMPPGTRNGTSGVALQKFKAQLELCTSKLLGFKKPANEQERQAMLAYYAAAGHMEPCCDCGEDYPRGELVIDGHIYCPKCRKLEVNK